MSVWIVRTTGAAKRITRTDRETHLEELVVGRLSFQVAAILDCFFEGGGLGNHGCGCSTENDRCGLLFVVPI